MTSYQDAFVLIAFLGDRLQNGSPYAIRPSSVCPVLSVCLSVFNVGVLWPKGWMDQDETWHAGRPRPAWPHCVRWGPSSPPPKGHSPHPIFGPYLLRPNGCMDQDATWYGARPHPRRLCVRWRPRSTLSNKGQSPPLQFSTHFYCGQTAACIKMPLGMEVGLSPGDFVLESLIVLNVFRYAQLHHIAPIAEVGVAN